MIRIATGYPDLLNLYGDGMNAKVLSRYLEEAGYENECTSFTVGSYVDLSGVDFLLVGAGTERRMMEAQRDFMRYASEIKTYVEEEGIALFCGNAVALIGESVTDADGVRRESAGVVALDAEITGRRWYSELMLSCDMVKETVVGNINSSTRMRWRGRPLFNILAESRGFHGKTEGTREGNLFATELSGPLLLRNPALLARFAEKVADRKIEKNTNDWFSNAERGYERVLATLQRELRG